VSGPPATECIKRDRSVNGLFEAAGEDVGGPTGKSFYVMPLPRAMRVFLEDIRDGEMIPGRAGRETKVGRAVRAPLI